MFVWMYLIKVMFVPRISHCLAKDLCNQLILRLIHEKNTNTYYHLICIIDIYCILTVQLKINMDCKTIRSCKHSTIYLVVHLSFIPRCDYAAQTFQVCRTEKGHKWNEMNILSPAMQTHTWPRTASAHSSLRLERWQRLGSRGWIDGAQEVRCPLGGKQKLRKEQSDEAVCCPTAFFSSGSTLWADSAFYLFDHQALALTTRLTCRQLQSQLQEFSLCASELSKSSYSDDTPN